MHMEFSSISHAHARSRRGCLSQFSQVHMRGIQGYGRSFSRHSLSGYRLNYNLHHTHAMYRSTAVLTAEDHRGRIDNEVHLGQSPVAIPKLRNIPLISGTILIPRFIYFQGCANADPIKHTWKCFQSIQQHWLAFVLTALSVLARQVW